MWDKTWDLNKAEKKPPNNRQYNQTNPNGTNKHPKGDTVHRNRPK